MDLWKNENPSNKKPERHGLDSIALGFLWLSTNKKLKQQQQIHLRNEILSSNRFISFVNKQNLFLHLTRNKWHDLEKFLLHI